LSHRSERLPFSINREQVVSEMMDGETTLVHTETTNYYGLNATGTFIWNFLRDHAASLNEIVAAVSDEYDVAPAQIRADIQQLLQSLVQEGLIQEK
jgi:PqqD family protein of HPr-rel-A system